MRKRLQMETDEMTASPTDWFVADSTPLFTGILANNLRRAQSVTCHRTSQMPVQLASSFASFVKPVASLKNRG